jgi:hypothetical protein
MLGRESFLTLIRVASTSAGASATHAATVGAVGAWENNDYGQSMVPVASQSGVTAIAAGWFHSMTLKTDGSVVERGRAVACLP